MYKKKLDELAVSNMIDFACQLPKDLAPLILEEAPGLLGLERPDGPVGPNTLPL